MPPRSAPRNALVVEHRWVHDNLRRAHTALNMLPAMRRAALALVAALLVGGSAPTVAHALAGDIGHDVAQPQCLDPTLPAGVFGIVDVTYKKPYDVNPCLAVQSQWAAATGSPAVYVNTAHPASTSVHWPTARSTPVRCTAVTNDSDAGCAYDYGWLAARDALTRAQGAGMAFDPLAVTWWLDVEGSRTPNQQGNSWVGDTWSNAADLQGFVDGLRTAGVREVGIYSTAFQWADITGGYSRATARSYRAHWKFAGRYPMEDGPVWVAGVGDMAAAQSRCATTSFTGGERLLAQFTDGSYDGDVRCADPDASRPAVSVVTPTGRSTNKPVIGFTWRARDTGSGLASYDVRYRRAAAHHSYGSWIVSPSWERTTVRAVTVYDVRIGAGYCFTVRARDAAGNMSAWSTQRCVRRPS